MTSAEYGKIVSKNLKRIAYEHQKSQADISRDLKLKQVTVSSWMNGTRVPRMDKIDLLCHYFNCKRSDIMEEHPDSVAEPGLHLSAKERELIIAFRKAPREVQDAALRMFGVQPDEKENSKLA